MICPLQSAGACANPKREEPIDCDEENCAWWYAEKGKCAVLVLTEGADLIGALKGEIQEALNGIRQG